VPPLITVPVPLEPPPCPSSFPQLTDEKPATNMRPVMHHFAAFIESKPPKKGGGAANKLRRKLFR
jgi:hypothetical protein